MPIRPFIPPASFEPDVVDLMGRAYEAALATGGPCDEETKRTIAGLIITAAQRGERDVCKLCAAGLRALPELPPAAPLDSEEEKKLPG